MGLAFYLADDRRAINLQTPCANLSVELYDYMYRHSENLPLEIAFFYRLDPYGEESFDCDQAKYIAGLCGRLLEALAIPEAPETPEVTELPEAPEVTELPEAPEMAEAPERPDEDENGEPLALSPFLLRLRKLCNEAYESRSHIIMLGD